MLTTPYSAGGTRVGTRKRITSATIFASPGLGQRYMAYDFRVTLSSLSNDANSIEVESPSGVDKMILPLGTIDANTSRQRWFFSNPVFGNPNADMRVFVSSTNPWELEFSLATIPAVA